MKPTHNISLGILAWMLRHHRTIIRVFVLILLLLIC